MALLDAGRKEFDDGRHWHAHEAWEAAWHRAPASDRDFFRGLIHAAAALVHHARGNPKGFHAQAARMRSRLEGYRPRYRDVDVDRLLDVVTGLPQPSTTRVEPYPSLPTVGG